MQPWLAEHLTHEHIADLRGLSGRRVESHSGRRNRSTLRRWFPGLRRG